MMVIMDHDGHGDGWEGAQIFSINWWWWQRPEHPGRQTAASLRPREPPEGVAASCGLEPSLLREAPAWNQASEYTPRCALFM